MQFSIRNSPTVKMLRGSKLQLYPLNANGMFHKVWYSKFKRSIVYIEESRNIHTFFLAPSQDIFFSPIALPFSPIMYRPLSSKDYRCFWYKSTRNASIICNACFTRLTLLIGLVLSYKYPQHILALYEPHYEMLVLIAYASSECTL